MTKHQLSKSPRDFAAMKFLLFLIGLSVLLTGCASQKQSPEEVREKTAQATAELKTNARAVVQGVREGWSRGTPLDLNTATKDQLMSLPGITVERADRLIAGRPYQSTSEVVSRHIISAQAYERIKEHVTAKK
ncbi:MAG: helix-hairpin-helix domain-containing protein [Acidobacteriaceae bacterium]